MQAQQNCWVMRWFYFWGTAILFTPQRQWIRVLISSHPQKHFPPDPFDNGCPYRCELTFHCGFGLHLPVVSEVLFFFISSLAIYRLLRCKCGLSPPTLVWNGLPPGGGALREMLGHGGWEWIDASVEGWIDSHRHLPPTCRLYCKLGRLVGQKDSMHFWLMMFST